MQYFPSALHLHFETVFRHPVNIFYLTCRLTNPFTINGAAGFTAAEISQQQKSTETNLKNLATLSKFINFLTRIRNNILFFLKETKRKRKSRELGIQNIPIYSAITKRET